MFTEDETGVLKSFARGLIDCDFSECSPQHRRVISALRASPCKKARHEVLADAATQFGSEPLTGRDVRDVISKLRRKHPDIGKKIRTIWGFGYQWTGD